MGERWLGKPENPRTLKDVDTEGMIWKAGNWRLSANRQHVDLSRLSVVKRTKIDEEILGKVIE